MNTTPKKPSRAPKPTTGAKPRRTRNPTAPAGAPAPKGPSRAEQMLAMVQRPEGASVAELVAEFGVQPHSARAVVSVESRKRGIKVASVDGRIVVIE